MTQVHQSSQQLAGKVPILQLPTDFSRPPVQTFNGASLAIELSAELTQGLKTLAKSHTLFTVLLSAYQVLLHRYSGQDEIWIGVPAAIPRNQQEFSGQAGYLVNSMIVRTQFSEANLTFSHLMQQTGQQMLTGLYHQPCPPLAPAGFALERHDLISKHFPVGDYSAQRRYIAQMEGQLDIQLIFFDDARLTGTFIYNKDLFTEETIHFLRECYLTLLQGIVTKPDIPLSQLSLLSEAWRNSVAKLQYPAPANYFEPFDYQIKTLPERFALQVQRYPDRIAVRTLQSSLTYWELNQAARRLAAALLKCNHNQWVALLLPHDCNMVAGIIGILQAGRAYIPLDANHPLKRLKYIIEDTQTTTLVCDNQFQRLTKQLTGLEKVINLDTLTESPAACLPAIDPDSIAYLLYTSGSTGQPKGVIQNHRNVLHFIRQYTNNLHISASDKLMQLAAYGFDAAVMDIFGALLNGASLYPVDLKSTTLVDCIQWMTQERISIYHSTPSVYRHLVSELKQPLEHIRLVVMGGEPVIRTDVSAYQKRFSNSCLFINLIGQTESSFNALSIIDQNTVLPRHAIPVGYPVADTEILLLNSDDNTFNELYGEITICSEHVALGYWRQDSSAFSQHIDGNKRCYRTGDMGRLLPNGALEVIGRSDYQVKLRGFRIELGEIEAVLSQHKAVKEAVVTLFDADDNKQLVAYLTASSEANLVDELKEQLKAGLPDYMIPSHFIILDKLPLTLSGKIDRKALPAPGLETASGVRPKTPAEVLLAELMAFVLKRNTINRDDNFFELGGHSLLATQLISRIRDSFQIELSVQTIFEHPQLSSLAAAVEAATGTVSLPAIEAQSGDSPLILSFAQQRIWFLDQFEENNSATYNMPEALQLSGQLDIAALQQSLSWLQERHASLRTYFPTNKGQATVQVQPIDKIVVLQIHDLYSLNAKEQSDAVQNWVNNHAIAPFNLAKGPLFRVDLLRLSEEQSVLLLNMHHIISDGWSMGVFIRDWQHAYTAFASGIQPSLPSLTIQYSDYATWQANWLTGSVLQQQLDYWTGQLMGCPELLELPTDKPRPPQQSYQGAHYAQNLSPTLYEAVLNLSQQQGVTLFMVLLATFNILLSRYSRQNDISIGSPIANRTHIQTEDIIGFFVNTLVLRSQIQSQSSFTELLQETRKICLEAYAHQDIPFEMLVEQLQPARTLSHSPLFQVLLVLQNNDPIELALPGLEITTLKADCPVAKFDLTLDVKQQDGQLYCLWEYAADLFYPETIKRMAGHFEVLLTALVDNPEQPISHFSILTDKEREQLQIWNNTATDYPKDQTVVDLFEQQTEKTPTNIAVVFKDQQLTYQQLNQKANQLAHYLLKLKNGADDFLIAIAMERSLEMVIGLLGILKAGGAYVPIDPGYPVTRIRYMLEDSAAPLLLTQRVIKPQLESDCIVVCLDEADFTDQPAKNPTVRPQALVYVIYTSGSTGKPKGVMVEHKALSNYVFHIKQHFVHEGHFAWLSTVAADLGNTIIFGALCSGGALCVIEQQCALDAHCLSSAVKQYKIDYLKITPTHLMSLQTQDISVMPARLLIIGGEASSAEWVSTLRQQYPHCHILNHYGPTETTIGVTTYLMNEEADSQNTMLSIGKPISNAHIYILDNTGQPLPHSIPGELCIAGRGLARGYLNRPELTVEKFIEVNIEGKTERVYKTGDLARWLPDGNLEYLGRIDHQVKLRGFRIELGEIEAVLSQHEAVKEVVVILHEADDNKRLVAYLMKSEETEDSLLTQIKDWLKARLPDYMVPSHFMVLDKLPLTPNGKIDRKALPNPEIEISTGVKPKTPAEELLAGLWTGVLKRETIHQDDNFFELGGHSLLATQLISRIRDNFQIELSVRAIFEHPQLSTLAAAIEAAAGMVSLPAIEVQSGNSPKILSFAQQRLWFLNQFEDNNSATYNMPMALQLSGQLDIAALRQSLDWLLKRHESLRCVFPSQEGQATVRILDELEVLTTHDLTKLSADSQTAEVQKRTNHHAIAPFNLAQGPLFRAELLLLDVQRAVLLLNMHHIISDGWSMGVFTRDWQHAYNAFTQNIEPAFPPLTIQYSDYAAWQHLWLKEELEQQQINHWQQQLAGAPELLKLPTDKPRPEKLTYQGAKHIFEINNELTGQIQTYCQQQGLTMFMLLLGVYSLLLCRYSKQKDLLIATPVAGRNHKQTENLIGFFVNTLIIRVNCDTTLNFEQLLVQIRQTCLQAYSHQEIPFHKIVEVLNVKRHLNYSPLAQTAFAFEQQSKQVWELEGLQVTPLKLSSNTAKIDLMLNLSLSDTGLLGEIEFSTDLFVPASIAKMADDYVNLLEALFNKPNEALENLSQFTDTLPPFKHINKQNSLIAESNLTQTQQLIWLTLQSRPSEYATIFSNIHTFNIPLAVSISRFKQAFADVVQASDILRSVIVEDDGIPIQQFQDTIDYQITFKDLSNSSQQSEQLKHLITQYSEKPFDLASCLFDCALFKLGDAHFIWHLKTHQIITDGFGFGLIYHHVAARYLEIFKQQDKTTLKLPAYQDYLAEQKVYINSEAYENDAKYWQDNAVPNRLSWYGKKILVSSANTHQDSFTLSKEQMQKIHQLAMQLGQSKLVSKIAIFNIFLTTLTVYLHKISQSKQINIGVTQHNRSNKIAKETIGSFMQVLPLMTHIDELECFDSLFQKIKRNHWNLLRHGQFAPLNSPHNPTWQVMLNYTQHTFADFGGVPVETDWLHSGYATEVLTIHIHDFVNSGQLQLDFEFNCDIFEKAMSSVAIGHFKSVLEQLLDDPQRAIEEVGLISPDEEYQLSQVFNQTEVDYPLDKTIVDLFEQQVSVTPDNIAVVFKDQQLTYREFNCQANQIAHYLQSKGVKPEVLVGICVERSVEMVIGLLGILKAGGAYVPLDPDYPQARIAYMLNDSAAPLLLTQSHLKKQLFELEFECVVVCLDEVDFAVYETENPVVSRFATDLVYVIYTSGSTGMPKGAGVFHKGVINLVYWFVTTFQLDVTDNVLIISPFSFDLTQKNIFAPLITGGQLHLPVSTHYDPNQICKLVEEQKITWLNCAPSAFYPVLEPNDEHTFLKLSSLRYLFLGGEPIALGRLKAWLDFTEGQTKVINSYGPTECTDVCTAYLLDQDEGTSSCRTIPIGKPIYNSKIFILDKKLALLPVGMSGELCIAGAGLARGYLNRPELTAEKFIEVELFGKMERIYKTGDLARWLPDGNLEYLGRIDHQVKLRGFRIELGEIEAVLCQHEAVKEAVVTLYEVDSNKRLVAYLVKSEGTENSHLTKIKDWLKARLPDYMIPSYFTRLDKLPLTPNGKIDRKALPAPEMNLTDAYEAPRNDIEQQLAQIWSSLLKQNNFSIHDNFFSLGGDSILSIQIVARARQAGLHFTPRDLFEHQTIAELSTVIGFSVVVNAEQGLVTGECPLTPIQHWFFTQDFPEYWHFNQSILLHVPVDLDINALRQALTAVLSHHDVLRLRYHCVNGDWQQSFAPLPDTAPLFIEDLSQYENPVVELRKATQSYQTALNLTDGPLTLMVLLKLADSARLFWCIHHLVVDGVSWRILQEDLHSAYLKAVTSQPMQLPAKTSSFKAWSEHLAKYTRSEVLAAELAHWQSLPAFSLPIDNPTGKNHLEYYQNYTITLNHKETEDLLREVPVVYNTRINDILLAALLLALAKWSGKSHCLIDLEGHGRAALFADIDLSRTVGWFTTIHPIALTLPSSSNEDLGAVLKAVKEQLRATPNEGIGYGLLTQLGGKILPKGDILFNYLGQFDQGIEADFEFANETTGNNVSLKGKRPYLIDINGAITKGKLSLNWSYSGDCYLTTTIESLADTYLEYLTALIYHCQECSRHRTNLETLLPLHTSNNTQTALFCLPGLGSKAGCFRALAKALDTTLPVYGLESPGLDGQSQIPKTVEALGQYNLDIIKAVQPSGPYYLIGHSFGTAVALEIAWRLEQAGETLALLAVIDQPTPQCSPENTLQKSLAEFECLWRIVFAFKYLANIEPPFSLDDLKQTNSLSYACRTVMNWLKQENAYDILFSSKGLPEELQAYVRVYRANSQAFPVYQFQGKRLRCPIDLFCATESIQTRKNEGIPEDLGWREHTLTGVRIHQVMGSHFSMLNAPHVQGLANILTNLLKSRQAQPGWSLRNPGLDVPDSSGQA